MKQIVREGFCFELQDGSEWIVLFVTDDNYYCLCQEIDGDNQIYAVETIEDWLGEDIATNKGYINNIKTTITYDLV